MTQKWRHVAYNFPNLHKSNTWISGYNSEMTAQPMKYVTIHIIREPEHFKESKPLIVEKASGTNQSYKAI